MTYIIQIKRTKFFASREHQQDQPLGRVVLHHPVNSARYIVTVIRKSITRGLIVKIFTAYDNQITVSPELNTFCNAVAFSSDVGQVGAEKDLKGSPRPG